MKKLFTAILITGLITPAYAFKNESLKASVALEYKNASAIETFDFQDMAIPVNIKAQKSADITGPVHCISLIEATAISIKMKGVNLGLKNMINPNTVPTQYLEKVNFHSDTLFTLTKALRRDLETKNYKQLFIDSTKIKVTAILLHITVNTIQGNANYSGLLGDAIIEDANKLFAGIEELRKSDPNTYSFVTPKLKDKRFKASHKSATDENISDLEKLDQLRVENQISGLEFVKSVEEVVKQKEMWEIYQKESLEWYGN